jgi:Tfp pilus assembly protein PilO
MPRWTSFDIRQQGRPVLLVFLVLVVVNIAAGLVLVRPKLNELDTLRDEYEPRRQELLDFRKVVEARESYLATLNQTEADLHRLRTEVLSTKERRLVVAQLEVADIAEQFGVNVDEVSYENDTLYDEGLEYLGWRVPLEGGYTNLRKFIEAVEESPKFLVIESVSLDQAKDGGSLLQLNIKLATYFDAPELAEEAARDRKESRRVPRRTGGRS